MDKPISILRREFVTTLIETINGSGLDLMTCEDLMGGVLNQLHQEVERAAKQEEEAYYKALEEEQKPERVTGEVVNNVE